jgi:pantetheine-phosphate adenylyltransferase
VAHIKAVYAGMFDSITSGHNHILAKSAPLFSEVVLAIGVNPAKTPMFTLEQRLGFLQDVANEYPNVTIDTFSKDVYLVSYAASIGAKYIIRGLRNINDFEYELSLSQRNLIIQKKLSIFPLIETAFFLAERSFADISSSSVKSMIGPNGWEEAIEDLIPTCMWERFIKTIKDNTK